MTAKIRQSQKWPANYVYRLDLRLPKPISLQSFRVFPSRLGACERTPTGFTVARGTNYLKEPFDLS
jgi:hypothetical protein